MADDGYFIFVIFPQKGSKIKILKLLENSYIEWIRKIREFSLIINFMVYNQKCQFRLKIRNVEISRNSAYLSVLSDVIEVRLIIILQRFRK